MESKLETVSNAGYEPVGHFILPASSWTEPYYDPLAKRVAKLEPEWAGISPAADVLAEARNEIETFRAYGQYYGYAFFVMRRPISP